MLHPGPGALGRAAAEDGQVRPEDRRRHHHREVGVVVIGQRQHSLALPVAQTRHAQDRRCGAVGLDGGDVEGELS